VPEFVNKRENLLPEEVLPYELSEEVLP